MKSERAFDLVMWLLIAVVGLVSAYVCFGILNSDASGQFKQYSVGGAIAGALVSWGVLTSVYLQLRGSSNELKELRDRTEELQHKLIRGAPRPQGFETEVAERQRIVLARPKDWEPKGGTIFDLELPSEKMSKNDDSPAAFRCYFTPIDKKSSPRKQYYEREVSMANDSEYVDSPNHEIVRVGGELSAVDSLKFIVKQFVRTEIKRSPETGQTERTWNLVSRQQFTGAITGFDPPQVRVGHPQKVRVWGYGFRKGGVCYSDYEKRVTEVSDDGYFADVTLIDSDVAYPRAIQISFVNADARKRRSNSLGLVVGETGGADEVGDIADQTPVVEEPKAAEAKAAETKSAEMNSQTTDPAKEGPAIPQERVVFQEVVRMRLICYHEQLESIYFLDFWDDIDDFMNSSAVFNQIIASTRFLD